jgi:hypothetical protein
MPRSDAPVSAGEHSEKLCEGPHQAHYLFTTVRVGANACCRRGAESEAQRLGCMKEYEYSVQHSLLIESDRRTGGAFFFPLLCRAYALLRPSASWMGSMQRPLLHETSKVKKVGVCCFDCSTTFFGVVKRSGLGGQRGGKGQQGRRWIELTPTLLSFGRWVFMHNSFTFHDLMDRCDR